MSYHEDRFIDWLGQQDGQLGAEPGDALDRLRRKGRTDMASMRPRNRKLELKHETPEDRQRRNQRLPKSFVLGIHDRRAEQGPPPVLLQEYAEMEAQTNYRSLRRIDR